MKKNYFLGAAAAFGLFALASCSNEDDPISQQPGEEIATGEQVIVLDMQDTDVLSTKSRPLYSTTNQGAELVTDVKLLVFKHAKTDGEAMTLDKVLTINKWDQNSSDYNYGRKYTLKLEGTDKLDKDESYTILAVGQDESNTSATTFAPYQIETNNPAPAWVSQLTTGAWDNKTWNAGSDNGQGFLKTVARDGNEAEIFSGISKPVNLNFDGGFTAEVLLKRQVAGVLGYFTKIPAFVLKSGEDGNDATDYDAVKQIRLVASNKNTQIDLAHALGNQKDDATEVGKENVVNGFNPETTKDANFKGGTNNAFVVYTIDLSKWFKVANSGQNDATYWYTGGTYSSDAIPSLGDANCGTWVNAFDQANEMPRVATNSVLAGEFVIPFKSDKNAENNTFELQLVGGAGNEVLKSWNVKLDDMSIDQTQGDSGYVFNIYRNHLYQIGQRGGGDNPTDPGEDPDKPQPLDKDQELTIKINDNWEFIHDMEID